MDVPAETDFSCHTSMAVGEPMAGRGTRANAWLALGHPGPWGQKALAESDLSQEVKSYLQEFENGAEHGRVQLVRQPGMDPDDRIPLFLARSDTNPPWIVRFDLQAYDQLLDLRWESMLGPSPPQAPLADPIFLVCVNGRRDLCCARYGQSVYDALATEAPERTWQTTHLGGHRFAATAVVLPHGLHYGRLRPSEVGDLVANTDAGRVLIPSLRGRTSYPPPAQAAEIELRLQLRLTRFEALELERVVNTGEAAWLVHFRMADSGEPHQVSVRHLPDRYRVISTSGDPDWSSTGEYVAEVIDSVD